MWQLKGTYKGFAINHLWLYLANVFLQVLTELEVLSNGAMFFFAGYDTTATACSFLMYLLALNPEIQQKLYEEIVETLGDKVVLWTHC